MNAAEFAALLKAKRIGRDRWIARCPAHDDRKASLAITAGKKRPIVFRCMSQGCSADSILKAMGLKWRDLLGEGKITPEVRQRLKDQEYLKILENRWMAFELLAVIGWENHNYWVAAASKTDYQIAELKAKLGLYDRTGSF